LIEDYIIKRYQGNHPKTVAVREELIRVCHEFTSSGLADQNFESQLTSGKDSEFWSRLSEALVADCLGMKNISTRPDNSGGPDFLLVYEGKKIWVEVTCPEPTGLPRNWLNPNDNVQDFPHKAILLRWTAAIASKSTRLIGELPHQSGGYLHSGLVGPDDAYIIAVNGCQLRNGPFSTLHGISQFPFAAEAVFPIGPLRVTLDRELGKVIERGHTYQSSIKNKNNSNVETNLFLDPKFAPISAIWGVDLNGQSVIGVSQPMVVVHNPNANNPIPSGFLPTDNEYIATTEPTTNKMVLTRH
jgi:type I restriction enzyme S subunit